MSKRRKFTKEFKIDAVSLVTEQRYSRAEAARSLDIDSDNLRRWVKELENNETAFLGNGKLTEEQLEIRRLKEKVGRLTMEKEILKKATAFFAK